MPHFIGFVGGQQREHRVVIEGETLKEAMAKAGYTPLNQATHINRVTGQLTDGRRFSFRITVARPDELYPERTG